MEEEQPRAVSRPAKRNAGVIKCRRSQMYRCRLGSNERDDINGGAKPRSCRHHHVLTVGRQLSTAGLHRKAGDNPPRCLRNVLHLVERNAYDIAAQPRIATRLQPLQANRTQHERTGKPNKLLGGWIKRIGARLVETDQRAMLSVSTDNVAVKWQLTPLLHGTGGEIDAGKICPVTLWTEVRRPKRVVDNGATAGTGCFRWREFAHVSTRKEHTNQ